MRVLVLVLAIAGVMPAQTPTGSMAGTVRDSSNAAIAGVQIQAFRSDDGLTRTTETSELGTYNFPGLPAGEYRVEGRREGFQTTVRTASVETGVTTTADFGLVVGNVSSTVTVDAASPQLRYDSNTVGGSISRGQIENLPQNGRGFLELAKLEPGVQAPSRASSNRTFVPVFGAPGGNNGRGTRVTIDGGSIMAVGNGGSAMGLSQEAVQEFQLSTMNYDLSSGPTVAGVINVATRSGSNSFHGEGFFFFRDHNFAAYPALKRDPANPDPFFQRRQFGFSLGGPLKRDRTFIFGSWERNEQRGVSATTITDPDFAHFSRITESPLFGNLLSVRLDHRFSSRHTAFLRYSHDDSSAFGPPTNQPNAYPSSWFLQKSWADQSIIGLTSAFSSLVNDFRFSYFFFSAKQLPGNEQVCSLCLGTGAPSTTIFQTGLTVGSSDLGFTMGRRFHVNDMVSWQSGRHRIRFGGDWEHNRGGPLVWASEPATLTLWSPARARNVVGLPVPPEFQTMDEVLALPLRSVTVGVGDPRVPQAGGGVVRSWNTAHFYFQDTWQMRQRLVLNYGLGWNIDRNLNYDLKKPVLLEQILGKDGLGPTRKDWTNFAPSLGVAWSPSGDTVIRGGAGIFYDFLFQFTGLDVERAALGRPGVGRTFVTPETLNFRNPTAFTGKDLLEALPTIRANLVQSIASASPSAQQIEITKTFAGGNGLNGIDVPLPSALHVNAGLQRRIAKDLVVNIDLVYRRFRDLGVGAVDRNHYRSVNGPIIRVCTTTEKDDPTVVCSNGPINTLESEGHADYRGVLVRAEKRFSRNFQFLGSWALSRNTGTNGSSVNGFDLNSWYANEGPLPTDVTNILNLAGVARLRWKLDVGINFTYYSAPPLSAYLAGYDLDGDGNSTTGDLLPGSTVHAFNRGASRSDLEQLVAQFNQNSSGKADAAGNPFALLTLPVHYDLGDNFHSLDVRVSRSFLVGEHTKLTLIADAFNVYNSANLSGYSGDVTSPALFGQPTTRSTQVFGSGGPRAFQFAIRLGF